MFNVSRGTTSIIIIIIIIIIITILLLFYFILYFFFLNFCKIISIFPLLVSFLLYIRSSALTQPMQDIGSQNQVWFLLQSSINVLTWDVPGQKYFELNLLRFLFKLLVYLSTEKGPYLLLVILKL